jgi:hypothetical protein
MFRALLIASVGATALAACTATSDPYYGSRDPYYRSSASNPPGWVDRNRDGVDDRTQGSYTNPNNPPGWIDRDRDGRDDRVEQRRATSYRGGYYDSYGNWRSY